MIKVIRQDGSAEALKQIENQRDIALVEAAIIMAGECIARCPKKTGRLQGSITYRAKLSSGNVGGSAKPPADAGTDMIEGFPPKTGQAYVGTNVEYAPYVEYGTKGQRPQSFMRTGAEASKAPIMDRMRMRLEKDIAITQVKEEKDEL